MFSLSLFLLYRVREREWRGGRRRVLSCRAASGGALYRCAPFILTPIRLIHLIPIHPNLASARGFRLIFQSDVALHQSNQIKRRRNCVEIRGFVRRKKKRLASKVCLAAAAKKREKERKEEDEASGRCGGRKTHKKRHEARNRVVARGTREAEKQRGCCIEIGAGVERGTAFVSCLAGPHHHHHHRIGPSFPSDLSISASISESLPAVEPDREREIYSTNRPLSFTAVGLRFSPTKESRYRLYRLKAGRHVGRVPRR